MIELLHGTSSANAELIECKGLYPRGTSMGNWTRPYEQPSHKDLVYLTNKDIAANFHSLRTALRDKSDCCVLTVDVDDEDRFYPDENFFEDEPLKDWIKAELAQAQEQIEKNKDKWKECLENRGILGYKGVIDQSKIRMRKFPIQENPLYFMCSPYNTFEELTWRWQMHCHCRIMFFTNRLYEYKFERHDDKNYYTYHTPCQKFECTRDYELFPE
jgi:hypothetical protein